VAVISLAAGSPISLSVSGRTLPLGPADFFILILALTIPLWLRRLPPLNSFVVCALCYTQWVWASAVFWSVDYRRSVLTAKSVLEAAVVYLAAWQVAQGGCARYLATAIRWMDAVLALQIAWVVWNLLSGQPLGYYALKNGVTLPLGSSNYLALFLEFGLVYELLSRRPGWALFLALDAAGMLLTFSRGALLATGATLAFTAIVLLAVEGQRRVSLIVAGTLVAGGIVLVTLPELRIVLDAFSILGHTADSRIELWQDAWDAASWRPLIGVGYGAYESIGTARNAHSLPLALLAETGVVGLALFGGAIAAVFGRILKLAADRGTGPRRSEAIGVAGALAVVLMHSLVEPFFLELSLIWSAVIFGWIIGPWGTAPAPPGPTATPPSALNPA
jgi:O-antigen ligase